MKKIAKNTQVPHHATHLEEVLQLENQLPPAVNMALLFTAQAGQGVHRAIPAEPTPPN